MATEATTAAPKTEAPKAPSAKIAFGDHFKSMIASFKKPISGSKAEADKYTSFKDAAILGGIVIVLGTLIGTISAILNAVHTKKSSFSSLFKSSSSKASEWEWDFDNLNNLNLGQTAGYLLVGFAVIIFAVAGIYYIAGLIAKQNATYSKILAAIAIAMMPSIAASVVTIVFSLFGVDLLNGLANWISTAATVYGLFMAYESISGVMSLEGDKKVFVHFGAVMTMAVAYTLLINFAIKNATSDLLDGLGGSSSSSSSYKSLLDDFDF